MKSIGNFNKLPKNYKAPERLKKGEKVIYQLVEDLSRPEPDPNKKGQIRWPSLIKIPTLDTIHITYKDDAGEEQSDFFDIGLVTRVDKEGAPTVETCWINAQALKGRIELTGGALWDEKLYWLFEQANFNLSNPNRDTAKTAILFKVDIEGNAKADNRKFSVRLEAMTYASNMSDGQIRDFAASMNWDDKELISVLRNKVAKMAETESEQFKKLVEGEEQRNIKTLIKRAVDAGVINYDTQQHRIAHPNGTTLIKLDVVPGVEWLNQTADWIASSQNGKKVYSNIQSLMNKAAAATQ